ncbi:HNH endonuclease [Nonomuraea gerenzanensis]|uniref:HNH endonuclease n=1 Tax=Nonomuraea gerenzanensis TaxID=93944 RepID=UPI001CD95740|nr:HNH endonuclease signature motif containing protein [Nonomuraea gerenzanensis]UBU14644.1 HNH endonuclease [Nonomuraea gerenzanensis]
MAISERTRKIIWVESGGRCAICRRQVLTPGSETDDPSIFGEECHIVARGASGPRAGGLREELVDHHSNLLLLCSEHHKQIDDQVATFAVERLHEIKKSHREWIARLGNPDGGPVRLVPDPSFPRPRLLTPITTGNALWEMLRRATAFEYAHADHQPEAAEDLTIEFLDMIKDYLDIASELDSIREQRDAAKLLGGYISRLAESGYIVGAWVRHMLLTGGPTQAEPSPWEILRVEVIPAADAEVVDSEGKLVTIPDPPSSPQAS